MAKRKDAAAKPKSRTAEQKTAVQTTMGIPPPATATEEDVRNADTGAESAEDVAATEAEEPARPIWRDAFDRAWEAYQKREWEACSTQLKLALVDGCDTAVAWDLYSVAEWKLGRKDSACEAVREALARDPQNARVRRNAAKMGA